MGAYLAGDLTAIEAIVLDEEEMAEAPAFYERMLFARNERWLGLLRPQLDEGNIFVAVGAGHLLGDRGVTALLEAAGYRCERITVGE